MSSRSHWGPFHQRSWSLSCKGKSPLEAQSAGFCVPATCLQQSGGSWSIIRFPTYVLNRRGLPVSQVSTMVLSVQANTEVTGMFKILLPWQSNFVSSCATQLQSRNGKTLDRGDLDLSHDNLGMNSWISQTQVHNTTICIFRGIAVAMQLHGRDRESTW